MELKIIGAVIGSVLGYLIFIRGATKIYVVEEHFMGGHIESRRISSKKALGEVIEEYEHWEGRVGCYNVPGGQGVVVDKIVAVRVTKVGG